MTNLLVHAAKLLRTEGLLNFLNYSFQSLIRKVLEPFINALYKRIHHKLITKSDILIKQQNYHFSSNPLISVIIPTYNTNPRFLKECIESVLTQTYSNWEIIVVDDYSANQDTLETLKHYSKLDSRINVIFSSEHKHISHSSNIGVRHAKGQYIAFLDHDDVFTPDALFEVVKTIENQPLIKIIYSDEDKINANGQFVQPFFKPNWNSDWLLSVNYLNHLLVIKKDEITKVGGFSSEVVGAQDWDLLLRITRQFRYMTSTSKYIYHIPKVLYSWRIHSESTASPVSHQTTKVYAYSNQEKVLTDYLEKNFKQFSLKPSRFLGTWKVTINGRTIIFPYMRVLFLTLLKLILAL